MANGQRPIVRTLLLKPSTKVVIDLIRHKYHSLGRWVTTLASLWVIVVLWHIGLVVEAIYCKQVYNLCIVAIVSCNLMNCLLNTYASIVAHDADNLCICSTL